MKLLSDFLKDYYEFSGIASNVSRQAAYAAIAIIWIFNTDKTILPKELLLPSLCTIICLASDLLQYVWATAAWGIFRRLKEIELNGRDEPVDAPPHLNLPTLFFFWSKIFSIIIAYYLLIQYVYHEITFID
ncbi:hypothetical protein [Methylomonas sp. MgM2]